MLDQTAPVLIQIQKGTDHSFCIANIVRDDHGDLYGEPFITPSVEVFGRLERIPLDERFLELLPDNGTGKPLHRYRGIVRV